MKKTVFTLIIILLFLVSCGNETSISGGEKTDSWQDQYDLGIRLLSEGNYEEAIIAFTAAIEIDSKQALTYVGRGQAYVAYEELDDRFNLAKGDFEQALELDDTIVDAWVGLARTYLYMEDFDAARDTLMRAIDKLGKLPEMNEIMDQLSINDASVELTRTLRQGDTLKYDDVPSLFNSPADSLNAFFGEGDSKPYSSEHTRYASNREEYQVLLDTYMYYGKKEPNQSAEYDVWVNTLAGSTEVYNIDANCFHRDPITGYSGWRDIYFGDTEEEVLRKLGLDASYAQFKNICILIYPTASENTAYAENEYTIYGIPVISVRFCNTTSSGDDVNYIVQFEFNNRETGVLDRVLYSNTKLIRDYEASIGFGG